VWHKLKRYGERGVQFAQQSELLHAVGDRVRSWRAVRRFNRLQASGNPVCKEYAAVLPDGYPTRRITLRLSVPTLPKIPHYAFSDHSRDANGNMTDEVLAVARGGFAISRNLGHSWEHVHVPSLRSHFFIRLRGLGRGEYVAQAIPPDAESSPTAPVDLLVVSDAGEVLAHFPRQGSRWHGCRSVDCAGETLMYAEYPNNNPVNGKRPSVCRVWRSRDRGRSWTIVFEQTGQQIRHFHYLQAAAGIEGEWWLASGDLPHECFIWVSRDDGESWQDVTTGLSAELRIGKSRFDHRIFRLTDMRRLEGEILWATDDRLLNTRPSGASVFRSCIGPVLTPVLVGRGKWPFRSIVDTDEYFLLISQRSNAPNPPPEDRRPGVYLMPKITPPGAPSLFHLFDLDTFPWRGGAGFTFSQASFAAKDGVFLSLRSSTDVFPTGHKILRWEVLFD
jgi:hypothetical protein